MKCLSCPRIVPAHTLRNGKCGVCWLEYEMARGQATVLREAERMILGEDCPTVRTPHIKDSDLAAEVLERLGAAS